jgi:dienelactone hydrolase
MPMLGNHHDFVERLAASNPPAASFEFSALDIAAWRAQARAQALALLRYAPAPVDPAAELLERREFPAYTREKIMFSSAPGVRVPAYVLVPRGASADAPAPAIVALHCHGGYYVHGKEKLVSTDNDTPHLIDYRKGGYGGVAVADALAARGYVVIVIDAFYFGERRLNFQHMPPELVKEMQRRARYKTGVVGINEQYHFLEELMARNLFAAGATWMGVMSHDDRAAVGYLTTRPEVDAARIGCLGLSMGGMRTNWLHATEPRLKAAVSIGWMTDWRLLIPGGQVGGHSWSQYVPGLTGALELSDLGAMGEGALMVQSCLQDSLFTVDGMRATADRIGALFNKAGQPERYAARFYDAPHEFNPDMQRDAFAWLDRWLMQ